MGRVIRARRLAGPIAGLAGGLLLAGAAAAPAAAARAAAASPAAVAPAAVVPATGPSWRVDARLPLDQAELPQETSNGFSFFDVEAVGPQDAWAVGTSGRNISWWGRPVLRHWHGGRWLVVRPPAWMNGSAPGGWVNQLQAVGGSAPGNVWAVGPIFGVTSSLDRAVRWNGRRWLRAGVLPTREGTSAPLLTSVVVTGPGSVWAFGCFCGPFNQSPYIAHFSNGRWRDETPHPALVGGVFTGVEVSSTDIWALVAESDVGSFTGLLHWNGARWTFTAAPALLNNFDPGGGIVVDKTGLWLAGSIRSDSTGAVALLAGGKWSLTKTGAPTAMQPLVPDGHGGLWSATQQTQSASAQMWHFAGGHWQQAADPSGESGAYGITWLTHLPGGPTTVGIGSDAKNELLLSLP